MRPIHFPYICTCVYIYIYICTLLYSFATICVCAEPLDFNNLGSIAKKQQQNMESACWHKRNLKVERELRA